MLATALELRSRIQTLLDTPGLLEGISRYKATRTREVLTKSSLSDEATSQLEKQLYSDLTYPLCGVEETTPQGDTRITRIGAILSGLTT